MNIIMQTSFCMKWLYYNKIRAVRWFRAHNSLIRSNFWAHNRLIRSDFEHTIVWTMVWVWTGPWSHNRLDNGLIMVWSEVLSVWEGLIRDSFERTLVWSEDTLVWEGLIRGNFRLARSDQGSLPDGTSTWVINARKSDERTIIHWFLL